jgi:hypothetical protein
VIGWLTQFDVDKPYAPREVFGLSRVASGKRDGYLWARLSPRLERGDAGNAEPLEVVLLAPRHEGETLPLERVEHPIHVYVCTVKNDGASHAPVVDPTAIQIRHWAVLFPSREAALSSEILNDVKTSDAPQVLAILVDWLRRRAGGTS